MKGTNGLGWVGMQALPLNLERLMLSKLLFVLASLLTAAAWLSNVAASPIVVNESPMRIPLVRRLNFTGHNLLASDQARARYLKTRHLNHQPGSIPKNASDGVVNVGILNSAVSYIAQVRIIDGLHTRV